MKKILLAVFVLVVAFIFASANAGAAVKKHHHAKKAPAAAAAETTPPPAAEPTAASENVEIKHTPAFPEKGWHKGAYLGAHVGLLQVSNDTHIITGRQFGSWANLGYGLTVGWDINDWIGPMFQATFSTKTAEVGDSNGGNNGGAAYPSQPNFTFPANTFKVQNAREYVADVSLFARATLPYFTHAAWQPNMVKILPYLKLGGTGSGTFVNASANPNKSGAFGGGPAIGAGCEFFIWKGFFVAVDFTEHLIFQQAISRTINTNQGDQKFNLTAGGFHPHFSLYGIFGWHF